MIFSTLFMTWQKLLYRINDLTQLQWTFVKGFVNDLIENDEKVLRNIPNSRREGKNHTLLKTRMAKTDALFMTKREKKQSTAFLLSSQCSTLYLQHLCYPCMPYIFKIISVNFIQFNWLSSISNLEKELRKLIIMSSPFFRRPRHQPMQS